LGSPKQNELTLQNLLDIFWKRRRVVYGAALAPGDPGCAVNTRRYEATCTVQIEKESSDRLGLDILMNEASDTSDALQADDIIYVPFSCLRNVCRLGRCVQILRATKDTQ
jgi:uncharacterized protein involved in exopolysaccharide biosynthesis